MGWKTFNDRLALVLLGLVGAMLFFLAVKEPGLRDKILTLLGPWGTLVVWGSVWERQSDVDEVLLKLGIARKASRRTYLTAEGRRRRASVIDLGEFTTLATVNGLSREVEDYLRIKDELRRIKQKIPDLEVREYDYNDRSDSPELQLLSHVPSALPDSMGKLVPAVFESAKKHYLEGYIS